MAPCYVIAQCFVRLHKFHLHIGPGACILLSDVGRMTPCERLLAADNEDEHMNATAPMTDMFKAMSDSYAKSFNTGVKFFDETGRFWTETMNKNADDYRNRCDKMIEDFSATGKKNMDRMVRFFEEQNTRTMGLVKHVTELQPATTPSELLDRTSHVMKSSFDAVRDSVDSFAKFTGETMQNTATVVRTCETTEQAAAKKPATK